MKQKRMGTIIAFALCAGFVVPAFATMGTPFDNIMINNATVTGLIGNDSNAAAPDPHPLDGADTWAAHELRFALENDLILYDMIGNWTGSTNRLVAAEAIARLLESFTGKTVGEIAIENEYDLTDCFIDTGSDSANFLKQSGISNGVDGTRYDPEGVFTRAQMVTMLGRMAKCFLGIDTAEFPKGSTLFSDIPDWADEFVGWAGAAGITDGVGDGRFDSNGTLQNQQTGVFLWRTFSVYYKSRYELQRTGEYISVEQMEILKAGALSWQSVLAGVGKFANIVAIEPSDGSEQQVYLAFGVWNPNTGEFGFDDGYEKMRTQKPDGVQARIFFAESGAGSGELLVGYRFIHEDFERIELFYTTSRFLYNEGWENETIFQQAYLLRLSELSPEERQFR